ncbi:GTPase Era [bacterium]|nr:GTPase Era [candidate division CSSED10-310 bacterium]
MKSQNPNPDSFETPSTRFRSGFVGLIGWTNVGKSTLVNRLTGMKIAITADSPQTTRHRLVGIIQSETYQIALTDTPGIHRPRNELSNRMLNTTWGTIREMDLLVWMVFPDRSVDKQIGIFTDHLAGSPVPLIIAVNKIDTVPKETIIPLMDQLYQRIEPRAILPISAVTGENLTRLVDLLIENVPEGDPMYPMDQVTDQPERIIAAEYIREKVIENTYQEMPHVVAVEIEHFKQSDNRIDIAATIHVEKKSQKGIIIGAGGAMIKKIGTDARMLIAAFLDSKVDLQLWVKVSPRWRSDPVRLKQMGFGGV